MQIELFYYENTRFVKRFFIRRNKKIYFFDDLRDFKKFSLDKYANSFLNNYNKLGNIDVNKTRNKKEFAQHLIEKIIDLAPEEFL